MKLLRRAVSVLALFVAAALPSRSAGAAQRTCESLKDLKWPKDTTITIATMVARGAFDPPGATPPIDTAACRESDAVLVPCLAVASVSDTPAFVVWPACGS